MEKLSYNLVREPWITVRMLNGEYKKMGLLELFENIEDIKCLGTPVFRGEKCWIYEYCVLQFLTIIAMSAHYKEDNGYEAKMYDVFEDLREENGPLKKERIAVLSGMTPTPDTEIGGCFATGFAELKTMRPG